MDRRWLSVVLAMSASACSDIPVNHDTAAQCGCVAEPVRLSPVGSPIDTTATIAPCRTFAFTVSGLVDRPPVSCTLPMTCPGAMTGITVAEAVQHPDVQAALRAGPMRYGAGPGTTDGGGGPVYRVGVGPVDFEVAGACGASPSCTPIAPGVQALLDLLVAINAQEIRRSPCREVLNL
jgi:hypothetical protein